MTACGQSTIASIDVHCTAWFRLCRFLSQNRNKTTTTNKTTTATTNKQTNKKQTTKTGKGQLCQLFVSLFVFVVRFCCYFFYGLLLLYFDLTLFFAFLDRLFFFFFFFSLVFCLLLFYLLRFRGVFTCSLRVSCSLSVFVKAVLS